MRLDGPAQFRFDGIDLSSCVAGVDLPAEMSAAMAARIADLPDVTLTLRLGCSHPLRYNATALADPAELWRCNSCFAEWMTLRCT